MIFVTGPHAAGKTYLTRSLFKYGFDSIDLGPTLRSVWQKTSPATSFSEFIKEGEQLLGPHFTDELLTEAISHRASEHIYSLRWQDLLVTGNRSMDGINYISNHVLISNERPKIIIYLDAPEEYLHLRYCEREGLNLSFEDFQLLLRKDEQLGLLGIRAQANYLIENIGSQLDFNVRIEALIFEQLGFERKAISKEHEQ